MLEDSRIHLSLKATLYISDGWDNGEYTKRGERRRIATTRGARLLKGREQGKAKGYLGSRNPRLRRVNPIVTALMKASPR